MESCSAARTSAASGRSSPTRRQPSGLLPLTRKYLEQCEYSYLRCARSRCQNLNLLCFCFLRPFFFPRPTSSARAFALGCLAAVLLPRPVSLAPAVNAVRIAIVEIKISFFIVFLLSARDFF